MQRFKRILFYASATSRLDPALDRAVGLAQRNGARLTLIDVLDPVPGVMGELLPGWSVERLSVAIRDARQAELEDLAAQARDQGVAAEVTVVFGKAFVALTRQVMREAHDILIKGAPAGPAEGLVSTDMHLMRKCPVPIWVIKSDFGTPPRRILAAVDPDPEEPDNDPLNRKILELARALAAWEGAELHLVHAWQVVGESILRGSRARLSETEVDALERGIEDSHRYHLQTVMATYGGGADEWIGHVHKGEPAEVILATAEEQQADVVVMGTQGRSGLAGLFIGNTAEEVLKRTRASVLAVKPDDFRSPVEPEA
ncbi:universal stress protein [Thiohalorhabdus sp.]|uniref:universal stress protein n=1 Tax=Thiohalorhabdus sp. TaxID=3094134 RepID=UPI002FC2B177